MYYRIILTGVLCWLAGAAIAQVTDYSLTAIPEAVKKDANVVKRYENIEFEVTDIDRANLKVHQVLTILNQDGRDALVFNEYVNKYLILDDAEIRVFDEKGKQLNRYRKKDMRTVANGDGLIEDGYVTYLRVPASTYPVTVEFRYTMRFKGTFFYPGYYIQTADQGVEESIYTVRVPADLDIRYKVQNIDLKPAVSEEGKYKLYSWKVKNLAPVHNEPGAASGWDSRYPSVQLAPNKFSLYGNKGDMSTWGNFGQWLKELYEGTEELPETRKAFFRDLVKSADSDREKTRILYQYLQQNFRYVSIQLGIGGYKPFSAEFTDQKKYGDCKALSNFMRAALKAVDVKSYVAIINAGYNDEPVDPAFPVNAFNHVILCVPQKQDSIWLECTSNTADFDVLGTFTENRNALLVTEQGGVLVPTPASNASNNILGIKTVVDLSENGSGNTHTSFQAKGHYREMLHSMLNYKKDDQKQSIVYELGFKQPDVFEFQDTHTAQQNDISLDMELEKIPEFTAGNKMFISPRLYKIWGASLPETEKRKLDFYFQRPFQKTDTTVIRLPAGFTPDALPKPKKLECAYASYNTKYWHDEAQHVIYSTASMELKQHRIAAKDYAQVKKFFDDVVMDDTQRIVIAKK